MAYETGTATSYTDLLAKLITFLTTNAALVSASQNWSVLHSTNVGAEYDYLLRGPGLAGLDQVHMRLYADSVPASFSYGIGAQAFVSYNSSVAHYLQPGISSACGMALLNSTMPYWFIANGRRFIVVAKTSTAYASLYGGLYLPYATPTEFPYPIAVLGSHESATTHLWSQANFEVGGFFDPSEGNAYLRHNDGTWLAVANYFDVGGSRSSYGTTCVWPYDVDLGLRDGFGGTFPLLPCVLHSSYSSGNVYGELDGVFFIPGTDVFTEDVVTVGADTYLVVQSVYRTDRRSYAALKLS